MALIIATAVVVALSVPEATHDPYAFHPARAGSWRSADRPNDLGPILEPLSYVPVLQAAPLSPVEEIRHPLVVKWSGVLAALRWCESRGDYAINTGNGYYGAYQWLPSTWASVGGAGLPSDASPGEQDYRAALMLERGRRGEWGC